MKRWIFKGALCAGLLVGLSGCMVLSEPLNPDEDILGTWISDESVAVYDISRAADGRLEIQGHSSLSGREMIVSDVSWDGTVLEFATYVAATDYRVKHENRLLSSTEMEGKIFEGDVVHIRKYKKENR
ncbi:MAG: hypothetical protein JXR23_06120 [Pontiellaceae bacterium]|nr:hypothetical protein [Pontiellaceae bacterium]